jgi:L-rhamnose mutarotase
VTARRVAAVIQLRPEKEAEYRTLHAAVWPEVLATLKKAGVSNYSIFLRDGLLFSYLEYEGDDFDAAMRQIANDERTKTWWTFTDPCQQPVATGSVGEWWAPAEEIFHLD